VAVVGGGTAEEATEKLDLPNENDHQGLKPEHISNNLRGPEGPLFHGSTYISEFFRSL
jgi:hypothetical protein